MTAKRLIFGITLVMALALTSLSHARMVHDFDCSFCHEAFTSENIPYMTYSVCLNCHSPGKEGTTFPISDGSPSNPITATFAAGDGSNARGSNGTPGAQTSHFFAGSADVQPAAGALAPANWRFNVGWARGLVTCSRCHNPHGDTSNPKLLKLGAGKADAMCLDCHRPWNQKNNHGKGTHPLVDDYPSLAAANPDKLKSTPDNSGTNGSVALVDETKVSCTSCHSVHFADSSAATADDKGATLVQGDGKLLRHDGAAGTDANSNLCMTCHTYAQHGGASGLGCMVCHGGHEHDAGGNANYYILKKQVALDPVPKTGAGGTVDLDYTDYPAHYDLNGICLQCHNSLSTNHLDGYTCTDCHQHKTGFTHVSGSGGYGCEACHAADHVVKSDQANWVTIFDNTATHSSELGSNNPGPIYTYATCSLCHTGNLLSQHANDCHKCHAGASPPAASFGGAPWNQTCQQGSCHPSYHDEASNLHDEYYWNARETNYGNCDNCHHGSGFNVPWPWDSNLPGYLATASDCGFCHRAGGAAPAMGADAVAPVSHSDLQPAYFGTAVINIWATDSRAIKALYYRLDNGPIQTLSGGQLVIAPPESGVQSYTLEYWARDWTGNTETPHKLGSFTVTKDTVPPVTTSDAKSIYGGTATIQLSATDNATSFGVAATYYQFDGGEIFTGTTAVMPEPASGSEEHILSFWSVDHVGNVEAKNHVTFTIIKDEVAPSTTSDLQPPPHYYSRANLRSGSYLDITLTAVDPEPASGVAGIQLSSSNSWMKYESDNEADWNGSAWEIAVYFIGDGYFPISYAARDRSGNVEAAKTTTIAVDRVYPDTESDAVPEYSGTATIFLTATDNFSGVDTIYYQIDSGPEQVYNPATGVVIDPPASGSAAYRIFYWAVDVAGNIESRYSNHAYDTNRAEITIWETGTDIAPPTGSVTINGGDVWTNSTAVTLTLDASDADGTLTDMQFSNDGITWSGWESYATSKEWTLTTGAGTKTVYVQYRDAVGHISASYSDSIGYENIAPTTTIDTVAGSTYLSDDFSGIKTFTLSASDIGGSGVADTWWQLDGTAGAWTNGTSVEVPAPESGTTDHTIYWYSVDEAGNQETQKSVTMTMEAGGLEHTGMTMAPWVSGFSDPYYGAARELADPWVGYQVFIGTNNNDKVPLGEPVMKTYNTYIASYNGQLYPTMPQTWTTTWSCPPDIATTEGSKIYLVVNAGFSDQALWTPVSELPETYEFPLPAGTVHLEPVDWTVSIILDWKAFDYFTEWSPYEGHSSVNILPSIENIVYVTTAPDTTAPVTGIDAVSGKVYGSAQTFTLIPQDEIGGTGVENTWWQLDSTSGSWTKGTSVGVTAPPTGATKAHTLYWYSEDHAGNQEAVKSVSFSVETLRTLTTSIALDQAVWYEAVPDGSGPYVRYTVKLDGVTLGSSFPAAQATTNSKTFNRSIPETEITGAGQIDIIVNAGFTTTGSWGNNTNSPQTFSLTLPPEASRLSGVNWAGFPKYNYEPNGYYFDWGPPRVEYPYSSVAIPTGTIGNIRYQLTGSDTDITPPVTTIDAVNGAVYTGDQAFTLSASDADSGVESTWWQLDGGAWHIGTSVPVAAPESGSAAHTITWYSRDHATNQEAYQAVTFSVTAGSGS